jgi:roundabout axon guidance receptor 2
VLVTVKPFFSKEPSDVTVLKGQSVQFQCRVGGDPDPNILWRRDDGKMPIGRAQILDDKSLRIENVEPVDEGLYICDAENLVGSVSAQASLTVHCECPQYFLSKTYLRVCLALSSQSYRREVLCSRRPPV